MMEGTTPLFFFSIGGRAGHLLSSSPTSMEGRKKERPLFFFFSPAACPPPFFFSPLTVTTSTNHLEGEKRHASIFPWVFNLAFLFLSFPPPTYGQGEGWKEGDLAHYGPTPF